jgi:hypothetical protein
MKFIEPSYQELYDTLRNNNKLEKFFIKNKILNVLDDYYENYGYDPKYNDEANFFIEQANEKVYKDLTKLLLKSLDKIKESSLSDLTAARFLSEDLKDVFGFTDDIILPNDILWEIYFTIKYCCVTSFFQNNWENFIPLGDFEKIEENESLTAFMDAVMKEFDKLDNILDNVGKYKSYREIPYEYINYLSQLLGVEKGTFVILDDQEAQFRVLAENIMEVYSTKGTAGSFEVLFNLLGYNIEILQYYFDRRRYYTISAINTETNTNNINSYKYYLTTKDPRENILNELSTNEIVTDKDFSEKCNIKDFDELVEKYGLMCVLGYDDFYITNEKNKDATSYENTKKYNDQVFKYFKTNYVKIVPTLKYKSGNFTQEQLYQLAAITKFLIPEFMQRELYVEIDTGDTDEKMVLNWTKDQKNDNFYMLDSEEWNQNYTSLFITNYFSNDGKEGYLNSDYSITPYRSRDIGENEIYVNSLGKSEHYSNGKYHNVFFNPVSEKIKIINTTKYWGDKVKVGSDDAKLYPIYRINGEYTNLSNGDDKNVFVNPIFLTAKRPVDDARKYRTIYFPRDLNPGFYINERDVRQWKEDLKRVDLNGYATNSLKNKIREMIYSGKNVNLEWLQNHTTDELNGEINKGNRGDLLGVEKVDWIVDDIDDFLDLTTDSEEWDATKKKFFETDWRETDNYIWKVVASFPVSKDEYINSFAKKHKNIINYNYLTKELFCINDFCYLGFSNDKNKYAIPQRPDDEDNRLNSIATDVVNKMCYPGCYFIALDSIRSSYLIYKYTLVNSYKGAEFRRIVPTPVKQGSGKVCYYTTYNDLINSIKGNTLTYQGRMIDLSKNKDITFNVLKDNEDNDGNEFFYKPTYNPSNLKRVIHPGSILNADKNIITLTDIDVNKTMEANELGSFYFKNGDDEISFKDIDVSDIENDDSLSAEEKRSKMLIRLRNTRKRCIYQNKYINIKKGDIIFSKSNGKLYRILGTSIFKTKEKIRVNSSQNPKRGKEVKTGGVFGIEEINFYGNFKMYEETNEAYIFEYDENYKGFSEQQEDDDFIFNNYDRIYEWDNLKIYSKDENNLRPKTAFFRGEEKSLALDDTWKEISNKRPIKVNIDKVFDERDENNSISDAILDEIYNSNASFIDKNLYQVEE